VCVFGGEGGGGGGMFPLVPKRAEGR